jgi:hypothetical protein
VKEMEEIYEAGLRTDYEFYKGFTEGSGYEYPNSKVQKSMIMRYVIS